MCDACVTWGGKVWHIKGNGYYCVLVRLHRAIWEEANGPIPPGGEIHHKNGDKTDNRLENLELRTKSQHMAVHGPTNFAAHREKARRNSLLAIERNRQERLARTLYCVICGGEYHSPSKHPTSYCSSKCLEASRSGAFKGEQRLCAQCGGEYTATKRAQRYCSRACNQRAAYNRNPTLQVRTVECAWCGTTFESRRSNARFCTHACALAYHGAHQKRGKVSQAV